MTLVPILLVISWGLNEFPLLDLLADLSAHLHQACVEYLRVESTPQTSEMAQALTCGQRLPSKELKSRLQELGVIHLMIISGAHVHFFKNIMNRMLPHSLPLVLRHILMTVGIVFFALTSGLQPPTVRACIFLGVKGLNAHLRLHWRPEQLVLISGALVLVLQPRWWNSHSFLLSWLAAFTMTLPVTKIWHRSAWFYLLFTPLFWFWGKATSPLTIFINVLAMPLFSATLFPLTLFCSLFPEFTFPWLSLLWKPINKLTLFLHDYFHWPQSPGWLSIERVWLYILLLQLIRHLYLWWHRYERNP